MDIFECFFLQYTTDFITFSLTLTKKKRTGSLSCSVGVANLRAITDQIFSGLHARKEAQPRQ